MKIYNKLVLNIDTLEVLEEDSFEWNGDIAECKGGGTVTTTNVPDYEYNARMAKIAEKQQSMADAYFNYWKTTYLPYEKLMIEENKRILPYERMNAIETLKAGATIAQEKAIQAGYETTSAKEKSIQAGYETTSAREFSEQMGLKTDYLEAAVGSELELIPKRTALSSKFYEEAMTGVNIRDRMRTAGADVAAQLKGSEEAARREATRMGLGGKFMDMLKTSSLDRARAVGLGMSGARIASEQENFQRLATGQDLINKRQGITF